MKRSLRLALAASFAVAAAAPLTSTAHAWSCTEPGADVACLVVGTACRQLPDGDKISLRDLCTFG